MTSVLIQRFFPNRDSHDKERERERNVSIIPINRMKMEASSALFASLTCKKDAKLTFASCAIASRIDHVIASELFRFSSSRVPCRISSNQIPLRDRTAETDRADDGTWRIFRACSCGSGTTNEVSRRPDLHMHVLAAPARVHMSRARWRSLTLQRGGPVRSRCELW